MLDQETIKKLKLSWEKIASAKRILLVSHINPDVDALASLGALMEILKERDKEFVAWADGKGDNYYFLPNEENIIGDKDVLLSEISRRFNNQQEVGLDMMKFFDLVIVLDCGSIDRTSLTQYFENIRSLMLDTFVIEIDHHPATRTYANIEIKIPLASTTELLYYLVDLNNIELKRNLANCLLAGLLTDTANFLYPSVDDQTIKIAANLMASGAQFPKLLNHTWRNKTFLEMKLWGLVLANLKVNKKYNIASSVLSYDDIQRIKESYGFFSGDVFGDIAGFLSNLAEADIILLLREEELGFIKGSLRVGAVKNDFLATGNDLGDEENNHEIDVNKLAQIFGGGGHKKAAGFMIEGHIVKNKDDFQII